MPAIRGRRDIIGAAQTVRTVLLPLDKRASPGRRPDTAQLPLLASTCCTVCACPLQPRLTTPCSKEIAGWPLLRPPY